jgi:hypothetical protein
MNTPTTSANDPVFNIRGLLDANIPAESDIQTGMQQGTKSFAEWLDSRVARFATRRYDWDALKFQADYDPTYRRAQMRYVGTGGTGALAHSLRRRRDLFCHARRNESRLRKT